MGNKINKKVKEFIENYYYPLKSVQLEERIHKEGEEAKDRQRNPFQRDYSRILYSSSFRRLQGKMQLLGVESDKFFRNRLTHSLEVSQIARGIAERLRELSGDTDVYQEDMYVVEAASLAHDIGNPPFGHHGERILNKIIHKDGGFEGNAQTFRILHRLEKKLPNEKGLNLTKRTLLSVIKYFKRKKREKIDENRFIYDEDYDLVNKIRSDTNINLRTVDVQIMDLADEIAYGAHDLEDALSLHLFSIDEFLYEFELASTKFSYKFLERKIKKAHNVARKANIYHSSEEYAFLFRKELISNLVHELIKDIGIVCVTKEEKAKTGTMNTVELDFKTLGDVASSLKRVTFEWINRSDIVQIYEKRGEKIIKGLFEAFMDEGFNKDNKLLPIEYRSEDKSRAVVDYIAGMMDSFAVKVYKDIYGENAVKRIYKPEYFSNYTY